MNGYMILFLVMIGVSLWTTVVLNGLWLLAHMFSSGKVNPKLKTWSKNSLTFFVLSVLMFFISAAMEKM